MRFSQITATNVNAPPVGLTTYAEDQVLVKQEEQMWASLFAPSVSVAESAKGFTAQLQEMSFFDEVEGRSVEQLEDAAGEEQFETPVKEYAYNICESMPVCEVSLLDFHKSKHTV